MEIFKRLFGLHLFLAICNSCRKRHNEKLKEYQLQYLKGDGTLDDSVRNEG